MSEAWDEEVVINTKPRIIACLPYNASMMHMQFMHDTWEPIKHGRVPWCEVIPLVSKVPSISHARNSLVQIGMTYNPDYFFFIDGDIIFEGQHPLDGMKGLFDVNKPIVAGWYRAKKREGFDPDIWLKNPKVETGYESVLTWGDDPHTVIQVDATGMGCCLIKADVFRKLTPPWFVWNMPGEVSEDFYFFEKAIKELGDDYRPWINTDIKLTHLASVAIKSDGKIEMPRM